MSLTTEGVITIVNKGRKITETNYFNTDMAKDSGALYLSWNAGVGRLLVPDSQVRYIKEMKTGKYVIVSLGNIGHGTPQTRPVYELLFEDFTNGPFAIHIAADAQSDRLITDENSKDLEIDVITRAGVVLTLKGKFRTVPEIPWLKPW